jgi:cell division protein FtsQ
MAVAGSSGKRQRGSRILRAIRYGLLSLAVIGALAGAIYGAQRAERFLIEDPRFALPGPTEYGQESPNIHLSGVKWASRARILQIFRPDLNRSLYLLPLAERRRALLNVPWVREASLTRMWPNELAVRVEERQPVAFLQIPFGPMSRFALIDGDGVILEPPEKVRFNLPVIAGVEANAAVADRSVRVHRMQQLMNELGPLGADVSEIDVGDLDNLKVREQVQDHNVLLDIGDHNFAGRMRTFVNEYPNIRRRLPAVAELDLRIDDRITAVSVNPPGGGRQ